MSGTRRSAAGALIAVTVLTLPRAYRPRYRRELGAELRVLPPRDRLGFALRVLLHSPLLRVALTQYRPSEGDLPMSSNSKYNNSELHHRQHTSDVGHAVLGDERRVRSRRRWRVLAMPLGLMALGLILSLWGPLPGLGMFLCLGGAFALVPVAVALFNDMFT